MHGGLKNPPAHTKMSNVIRGEETSSNIQLQAQLSKLGTAFLVLVSLVSGIAADQMRPGWGRSVGTTVAVFMAAPIMWRQLRRQWWFWVALLPILILQCVILWRFAGLRILLEEVNPIVWGLCAVLDFVCVATVVVFVGLAAGRRAHK
jgi:hypothetical protein